MGYGVHDEGVQVRNLDFFELSGHADAQVLHILDAVDPLDQVGVPVEFVEYFGVVFGEH